MNKYRVSVIVLNLIVLSNLSYADNNLTNNKEKKLEQLIKSKEKISISLPSSLPKSEQLKSSSSAKNIALVKSKEKVSISLPKSEQLKSLSNARDITLEEIKKRLEEVERNNIKEKIAIENFEKKVEDYKKKIYKLYD